MHKLSILKPKGSIMMKQGGKLIVFAPQDQENYYR
jgi:hypothetical protein